MISHSASDVLIFENFFSSIFFSLYEVFKVLVLQLFAALDRYLTVSGDREIRTLDPLLARQVLSQLSYIPIWNCEPFRVMGLRRLELPTSRLSGVRSNQLSYKPILS